MRFNMVTLQIVCYSTLLAFSTFFNYFVNNTAGLVCSLCGTTIPFWMLLPRHISASSARHTRNRTVFTFSSMTFSNLKFFTAFFANTVNHCSRFSGSNFLSALMRTRFCNAFSLRFKCLKFIFAYRANKCNIAFLNGVCHG